MLVRTTKQLTMGLKKRAPIDTRDEHGNLYERRFHYCGDVETYWGSNGKEFLHKKWVARNNTTRTYCGSDVARRA